MRLIFVSGLAKYHRRTCDRAPFSAPWQRNHGARALHPNIASPYSPHPAQGKRKPACGRVQGLSLEPQFNATCCPVCARARFAVGVIEMTFFDRLGIMPQKILASRGFTNPL